MQTQVWRDCTKVTGTKLLLLLALADYADDNNQCFPKIKTLAARIRTDERGARKHMKALRDLGYVKVVDQSNGKKSNVYEVVINPVKTTMVKKTGQNNHGSEDRSNPVISTTPPILYNEPSVEPPYISPINSPQGEKQKQKRKSRIPENFQPADKNYALQYGIENPDLAVEIFCDWAIAGAKTYIDWNLTWKTACRTWLPEKVLQAQANQSRGKSLEEQNQHMKPVEPIEEPDGWRDTAAKFTARPDLQHKEWTKLAPREREVILEKMKV